MAFKERIASTAEESTAGESPAESDDSARPDPGLRSPFSMNYETDSWDIDTDDVNTVLTGVIAVANLL